MPERREYPPGVPCWIETAQPDPVAAAAFYGGLFGWEFDDVMPAGSSQVSLVGRLGALTVAAIGSQTHDAPSAPAWSTSVAVASAEDAVAKVRRAGGSVLVEPFDFLDAGRKAVFSDRSGAVLGVWEAKRHAGAQLVNAPGSWNWSDLNTRDPDGAKAFYGQVFGWEARSVDLGFDDATMWCVPGYGAFLETIDPDLRSRQADAGVPESFADAIGWMTMMTSEQFPDATPSHWSVTFAVDDTDAIVDRAGDLGGTVLVPPTDAGYVSLAVLRDPQGASFTVSRYDPSAT